MASPAEILNEQMLGGLMGEQLGLMENAANMNSSPAGEEPTGGAGCSSFSSATPKRGSYCPGSLTDSANFDDDSVAKRTCSSCHMEFYSKRQMCEHMRDMHGIEKPFVCEVCCARFPYSSSLYNHTRIHSELKPFKCDLCEAAFRWKNSLKHHKRYIHKIGDESSVNVNDVTFSMVTKHGGSDTPTNQLVDDVITEIQKTTPTAAEKPHKASKKGHHSSHHSYQHQILAPSQIQPQHHHYTTSSQSAAEDHVMNPVDFLLSAFYNSQQQQQNFVSNNLVLINPESFGNLPNMVTMETDEGDDHYNANDDVMSSSNAAMLSSNANILSSSNMSATIENHVTQNNNSQININNINNSTKNNEMLEKMLLDKKKRKKQLVESIVKKICINHNLMPAANSIDSSDPDNNDPDYFNNNDHVTSRDDHVTSRDDHVTSRGDHVTEENDYQRIRHERLFNNSDDPVNLSDDGHVTNADNDHVTSIHDHVTSVHDHVTTIRDHVTGSNCDCCRDLLVKFKALEQKFVKLEKSTNQKIAGLEASIADLYEIYASSHLNHAHHHHHAHSSDLGGHAPLDVSSTNPDDSF